LAPAYIVPSGSSSSPGLGLPPANAPYQRARHWTSNGGPAWDGHWVDPDLTASAVLDLRYDGTDTLHPAKIDTRGAGSWEIDHLTFKSGGTDNFPIIQSTNTTLQLHDNCFIGNTANSVGSCVQDAIVLGGISTNIDATATGGFQGYGTVIEKNYFTHIRRGVFGQTFANNVFVRNNTFSWTCGGGSTVGAISFVGVSAAPTNGCVINDNLIEAKGYVYGIYADYFQINALQGNSCYDPGAGFLAVYHFEANAYRNTIIDNGYSSGKPLTSENGSLGLTRIIKGGERDWTDVSGSLLNSWQVYGGTYGPPAFRKDGNDVVHLRGAVKFGTAATAIFNLPAGYRPAYTSDFAITTYGGYQFGVIEISVAGNVTAAAGATGGVWLDGISFFAEN
jgi:carbonic anhydrase/acetyltransferase-like protein (isoleucine patch superfamily)